MKRWGKPLTGVAGIVLGSLALTAFALGIHYEYEWTFVPGTVLFFIGACLFMLAIDMESY